MFSLFFFRVKKNWVDVVTVPLLMAYTTRYFGSTWVFLLLLNSSFNVTFSESLVPLALHMHLKRQFHEIFGIFQLQYYFEDICRRIFSNNHATVTPRRQCSCFLHCLVWLCWVFVLTSKCFKRIRIFLNFFSWIWIWILAFKTGDFRMRYIKTMSINI